MFTDCLIAFLAFGISCLSDDVTFHVFCVVGSRNRSFSTHFTTIRSHAFLLWMTWESIEILLTVETEVQHLQQCHLSFSACVIVSMSFQVDCSTFGLVNVVKLFL